MRHLLALLAALTLLAAPAAAQTIKSLGFNTTNGQVVANTGTNVLTFTNAISVSGGQILSPMGTTNFVGVGVGSTSSGLASDGFIQGNIGIVDDGNLIALFGNGAGVYMYRPITFASGVEQTRTNLGLGLGLLTNTSITNFQSAMFSTNTAPTNTTNAAAWTTIQIGTNTFRVPLYQ